MMINTLQPCSLSSCLKRCGCITHRDATVSNFPATNWFIPCSVFFLDCLFNAMSLSLSLVFEPSISCYTPAPGHCIRDHGVSSPWYLFSPKLLAAGALCLLSTFRTELDLFLLSVSFSQWCHQLPVGGKTLEFPWWFLLCPHVSFYLQSVSQHFVSTLSTSLKNTHSVPVLLPLPDPRSHLSWSIT